MQPRPAYRRAAEVHRQVADVPDEIGQPDRAAEHRRLAQTDDSAAHDDEPGRSGKIGGPAPGDDSSSSARHVASG